jgi:hypothetical protein
MASLGFPELLPGKFKQTSWFNGGFPAEKSILGGGKGIKGRLNGFCQFMKRV